MSRNILIRTAALIGLTGVGLGAFGAHGLKPLLLERGTLSFWETAVLYQFVHLAAFILLALSERSSKAAYFFFVGGIVMFSGSLYLLALVKIMALVFVTPAGGFCLMLGWLVLLWQTFAPGPRET